MILLSRIDTRRVDIGAARPHSLPMLPSATEIAQLDRMFTEWHGAKCAACGRVWRRYYDDETGKTAVSILCACETRDVKPTGAAWH